MARPQGDPPGITDAEYFRAGFLRSLYSATGAMSRRIRAWCIIRVRMMLAPILIAVRPYGPTVL